MTRVRSQVWPRENAFIAWDRVRDDFENEDVTLPYGDAGSLRYVPLHAGAPEGQDR